MRSIVFVMALASCPLLTGCETGPRRAAPVDTELAVQSLTKALESWKGGERFGAIRDGSPPIIVQDADWDAGQRLADYRVGIGIDDNANLRCPVKLVLLGQRGELVEKDVMYVIGTDPVITVFREFR